MSQIGTFLANLRIPGVFWLAVIGFAIVWLPQLVPGAPWLDQAVLVLMALLKAVEVIVNGPPPAVRAPVDHSPWRRFFVG